MSSKMVSTGGTLRPRLIELIGELNKGETIKNINRDIGDIEKQIAKNDSSKVRLYVELFARVDDMKKDITAIQSKINNNSGIKDIKLGISLGDINVKDINEQISNAQKKFNEASTASKLKLDIDFNFEGSASKIKAEMDGIRAFMKQYGDQMRDMKLIDMDSDAQNVARNAADIKGSMGLVSGDVQKSSSNIERYLREAEGASGKFAVTFKQDVSGAIDGATASFTQADGTIRRFNLGIDESNGKMAVVSQSTKVAGDQAERYSKAMADAERVQASYNRALEKTPYGETRTKLEGLAQTQLKHIEDMRTAERVTDEGAQAIKELGEATTQLNAYTNQIKIDEKFREVEGATRELIGELSRLDGASEDVQRLERSIDSLENGTTADLEKIQAETRELIQEFGRLDTAMSNTQKMDFKRAVDSGDINAVKKYVEELYNAEVATIRMTTAKDKAGNSVDRMKIGMREANGAIDSYTVDMNRMDGSLRQVDASTKTVSDSTRGLDNSFKGVLGRITQYFGAIQLIQTAMRGLRKTIDEILTIDASMIELSRVASDSLNLDFLLSESISLSKELGSSLNDVVGAVGDMARTFGEFNEEQLLAIARTATIMSNVSDYTLEQSTSSLVAGMKAFNIEAEDSIRIVNVLNEVNIISLPLQKCS